MPLSLCLQLLHGFDVEMPAIAAEPALKDSRVRRAHELDDSCTGFNGLASASAYSLSG
jgi:hypothetical protein